MTAAVGESFEAPEYEVGTALPAAWQKEGTAEITAEESAGGSQSLKVGAEGLARYGARKTEGIFYVDGQILPVAGEAEVLNLGGARLGFGAGGKVLVFAGDGLEGRAVKNNGDYAVADGVSEGWVRVTVRVDAAKGTWDLFIDGKPGEANLPLGGGVAALQVQAPQAGPVYLDDYVEAEENPLFADRDKDGLPDAEERANGLNDHGDDRDGDGISNVEEFFAGSSPRAPGALASDAGALIYVDNLSGSDGNSGRNSYVALGSDGPKASLKRAMEEAPSGSTIVLLKGTGIYDEGTRGVPGKPLTIKPVDAVTIK